MGDEKVLLILPEPDERYALLVSSNGRAQAFQIADEVALEAFVNGMEDYTAMSLMGEFDTIVEELSKIHILFNMSADEQLGFLVRSLFRFAENGG